MKKILPPASPVVSEFLSKSTTRKGMIAEEIVDELLKNLNCMPYAPKYQDKSHPVDRIVLNCLGRKTYFCFIDVKCKPKRTKYPDTGINLNHYGKYKFLSDHENAKVYLFFVDEDSGDVYGNFLDVLDQERVIEHNHALLEYPIMDTFGRTGGIIYFPMVAMEPIAKLIPENIAKLRSLNTSEYLYKDSQQTVIDLAVQP